LQQIAYCAGLIGESTSNSTLKQCFAHAADLLETGLRKQQSIGVPGDHSGESLVQGVEQIIRTLRTLPVHDREQLSERLAKLDRTIEKLRIRLSRMAAAEQVELSLVSRGGVSLGSWQAGFLFSVTEWAKERPGQQESPEGSRPAFSTVTGASAGAVNGLAAAIEGCKHPNHSAADSLYYKVWMDLGLFGRHGRPGLLPGPEGGSSALNLFTDEAIEATLAKARQYIEEGEPRPSCRVDFGFVTTHIDRTLSPVHVAPDGTPILTTRKLKEKFAVRLDFDKRVAELNGTASTPVLSITNIAPSREFASDRIYYAGLGHSTEVPLESLLMGVRASGAFPAAFPPVSMKYVEYVPGPEKTVRPIRRVATFIDGGVLDNTPVGLAVGLDQWRNAATDSNPYLEGLLQLDPRTYIFLEPGVTSWLHGTEKAGEGGPAQRNILKTYIEFSTALLATSMDAQLTNTAEQYPFVRRARNDWTMPRLTVPERHMPITGEQFLHFMAFLERDFREFDFNVGMADAYAYLARESCLYSPDSDGCDESGEIGRLDAALRQENPLYSCMRAYYDGDDFDVLKRISTDDLPDECSHLTKVDCGDSEWEVSPSTVRAFLKSRNVIDQSEPDACIEPSIKNHNFRALIASMHNYKVWMQSDQYSAEREFDQFFDELSGGEPSEQFIFVDLPTYQWSSDGYLDAEEVKFAFRELIQVAIDTIAKEHEEPTRAAMLVVGRAAADIAYQRSYPKNIIGIGIVINGLEGTYGRRLWGSKWRWDTSFRFYRLQRIKYSDDLTPFTGELYLSTQATRIFAPLSYADIEVGAGWAAAETLALSGPATGHVAFRTGPRGYLALVLLQRLYIGVNIDYYPFDNIDARYATTGVRVVDEWEWGVAGGWRFLF
jgi:predicted acylesterase/phospholipase RssA